MLYAHIVEDFETRVQLLNNLKQKRSCFRETFLPINLFETGLKNMIM
jgi:hypothetical protein